MTQSAPRGLATPGRRFWRQVLEDYELSESEMTLLGACCRTIDEIARLEGVLRDAPTMVPGSQGQMRVHPCFSELRGHRVSLVRLMAALGLRDADAEADEDPFTARSAAGRRLALVRHHGTASGRVG